MCVFKYQKQKAQTKVNKCWMFVELFGNIFIFHKKYTWNSQNGGHKMEIKVLLNHYRYITL